MILRVRVCIPAFNNPKSIGDVIVDTLNEVQFPILVVDDGSHEPISETVKAHSASVAIEAALASRRLVIHRLHANRGKGAAIQEAIRISAEDGFTHLCTIDGDGQHYPREILKLVEIAREHPWSIVIGSRRFQGDTVPGASKFGRSFSNFWVAYQTGLQISDSQSGFRLYPLFQLQTMKFITRRYDFEIEVLIRGIWKGVTFREVDIDVFYPERSERVSHFDKFWDNVRISILNTGLVAISLMREKKSPVKMSASVGVGVLIGATPFFGFHSLLVAAVAFAFRLNVAAAFVGSQISLPPFLVFLIPAELFVGKAVLNASSTFLNYLVGSLVVGAGLGVLFALAFYLFLRRARRAPKTSNWNGRNRGGKFGNAVVQVILRRMGTGAGYFILRFIAPYFYFFAPRARRSLNEYYSVTTPMGWWKRQAAIVSHFYRFGQVLMDQGVQKYSKQPRFKSRPNGLANITTAVEKGQGAILLSAHVGSWSLAADLLPTKTSLSSLTVIEYTVDRSKENEGLDHTRLAPNTSTQPIFNINQLLRSGAPIGLMGDRPLGMRFELVEFFGSLAPIDVTPFRIAALTQVPVICVYGFKVEKEFYDFYAGSPRTYHYNDGVDRDLQLLSWAQEYADQLAEMLRRYPNQWFNFFPFWSSVPSAPPGVKASRAPNHLEEELRARRPSAHPVVPV
jgi:predicted LPLAT superfamily acyltransferase/glycosyltransferase involved in cell wall biosynthesis